MPRAQALYDPVRPLCSAASFIKESTMANPAPVEPEGPRPWYAGLVGFVFAALVLGAVALSTAASYDSSDDHGDDHSEEAEHSDDEHGDDEHGDDEHGDDEHGEDDHSE